MSKNIEVPEAHESEIIYVQILTHYAVQIWTHYVVLCLRVPSHLPTQTPTQKLIRVNYLKLQDGNEQTQFEIM